MTEKSNRDARGVDPRAALLISALIGALALIEGALRFLKPAEFGSPERSPDQNQRQSQLFSRSTLPRCQRQAGWWSLTRGSGSA